MRCGVVVGMLSAVALGVASTSSAAPRGAPDSFAELVEDVMPAVVNISTYQSMSRVGGFGGSQDPVSLGSGFVIDASGTVITNNHVIDKADRITVTLENGEEFEAELRGTDRETDLAVLQIKSDKTFKYVRFGDSDRLRVGDWVVAIGQPFGLGGSVSAGIVSAKSRDIESGLYDDFIQTDAAINRGNSGGPLFGMNGRVVGVNTIIFSQTGTNVGVGFAVPSAMASDVVEQILEFGETQRGYLGVLLADLEPRDRQRLKLQDLKGARVTGVPTVGGPAAEAGIRTDDVIIMFNGIPVEDRRDLTRAVAEAPVGKAVDVVIIRNGARMTVRVTVARRETLTASRGGTLEMSGLTLQAATNTTKSLYGLEEDLNGVVVTHVEARSPLSSTLRPGDVILEIGWDQVNDPESLEAHMSRLRAARSGPVQILVQRGEKLFRAHIDP